MTHIGSTSPSFTYHISNPAQRSVWVASGVREMADRLNWIYGVDVQAQTTLSLTGSNKGCLQSAANELKDCLSQAQSNSGGNMELIG